MYWEGEKECISREALRQLQLERLQATVLRVYMNVPFYRKKFDALGIDPDSFRSLEDVSKLPFTSKDDLRVSYPYGMFAVPLREVVRVQASSGTTGMPTAVGYTRNDIKSWSNLAARILVAGGVTQNDIVQIAFDYGLFSGALGLHYGAERIGASVIPISSVNTRRQVKIMQDFKTTALMCTPSFALSVVETIIETGVNVNSLSLKYGLFGAEPWSEAMRHELQEKLKIVATDNYGLSEVMSPGVAGECPERKGLHINEDHFLVEVVDPETLTPLPDGETGELVITTLMKEAFPVVRFRTRDLTSLITGPCSFGRTFVRMNKVMGQTDDMIKIRGITIFPSQIESVLFEIEGTEPHYQIILDRKDAVDVLTVLVEVSESIFFDQVRKQKDFIERIKASLASELGMAVEVKPVEKQTLERVWGKAKRVLDKRAL
ncbi:MAG: phenylacetate--CoA ligase family protein [Nitrospirales bacterium]|nr:MAG: phenylacetate--CoA ligase family protein [Nitrospirales bacterium]